MVRGIDVIHVPLKEEDIGNLLGFLNRVPIVGFAEAEGILSLRAKLFGAMQRQQPVVVQPPEGDPPERPSGPEPD